MNKLQTDFHPDNKKNDKTIIWIEVSTQSFPVEKLFTNGGGGKKGVKKRLGINIILMVKNPIFTFFATVRVYEIIF